MSITFTYRAALWKAQRFTRLMLGNAETKAASGKLKVNGRIWITATEGDEVLHTLSTYLWHL